MPSQTPRLRGETGASHAGPGPIPRPPQRWAVQDLWNARGVPLKDLAVFTRQLAALVNAGLTIPASLSLLGMQTPNPRLAKIITRIRADVYTGVPLSKALGVHPETFSGLYVNMVRAGEVGGVLDEILLRISGFLEKELALRQKVNAALIYPGVIAGVAVGVVAFLVLVILPRFVETFRQTGLSLPPTTQFLIWLTVAVRRVWPLLLLAIGMGLWGYRRYAKTTAGRATIDGFKLSAPLLGPINRIVAMARFARTLGTLVQSGVSILGALDVMIHAVDNVVLARALIAVRSGIREGESIAAPLRTTGVFSPIVVQMVAVGERTGSLDTMLAKAADFCDSEVDYAVARLMSLLEPTLILGMGAMVAFIVISFYLPLFNLAGAIK